MSIENGNGITPTGFFYPALSGMVTAIVIELAVKLLWPAYYSQYPLPGYDGAMAAGLVEPGFYNSSRSFLHAAAVFYVSGLLIALRERNQVFAYAMVFWLVALSALSIFAYMNPGIRKSNLGPITPIFLMIYTGPPFVGGVFTGNFISFAKRMLFAR